MKISAICPTFRRPELIEEALYSFLAQDYAEEKELIIVNDEKEQTLVFDHPQVKITNLPTRCSSLADKYNYAVSLATGDMITPWDDDDIFLHNRLATIANNTFGGMWYSDYMFTDRVEGELALTTGKIHCNHAYSARMFIQFCAYQDKPNRTFDFGMIDRLRATRESCNAPRKDNTLPSYIYRKCSVKSVNHSSLFNADAEVQNAEYLEKSTLGRTGEIVLMPHWKRDWTGMAKAAIARNPEPVILSDVDEAIAIQDKFESKLSGENTPEGE
jgi:glycosyltransferase involved in cell wall biosynthesis